ncbi:TPA: DUF4935 domain-containing protein [Stenotrophomonas maltophilia]|nr:DUF4935 domain-containing protein [Stenotrophomonas maltophilia]HEL5329166.1 DUF4935 domain-containing protein [Stenotrophomonas maltophilia]
MKNAFPGYYPPTTAEYRTLWEKGIFIFDTNTLLHLYRVPEATRRQMLSALRALKGRVWIPRHVGVEFQTRRIGVIKKAHQDAAAVLDEMDKALDAYLRSVSKAELAERGVTTAVASINAISAEAKMVRDVAEKTLGGQMAPTDPDTIRGEIDKIFEGKVGAAPENQAVVDGWNSIAKERYLAKRGPGYEDAVKADEPSPTFEAQGLTYERQYGDLYIWLQILAKAQAEKWENVVFVTRDVKEDWWRLVPGKEKNRPIVSPLESLTEEMRAVGVKKFWMYQLTEFLKQAEKHLAVEVSELTIKDAGMLDRTKEADLVPARTGPAAEELIAALGHFAEHTVEASPRAAVGYNLKSGDASSAEIVVPIRFAARLGTPRLLEEITRALTIVDLYVEVRRVNVYILSNNGRHTAGKERAYHSVKQALKGLVPRGTVTSVRFAYFNTQAKNELCVFDYDG